MTNAVNPSSLGNFNFDYTLIPDEKKERLAAATYDFIKRCMANPEIKKKIDERAAEIKHRRTQSKERSENCEDNFDNAVKSAKCEEIRAV